MNNEEHEAYLKEIKAYTTKLLKSKADALAFFQSAGILTKSGKLTKRYSNPIPECGVKSDNK